MSGEGYDVILVGGGLANSLIAIRLQQLRPELRVLILEAGPRLAGNQTWSFLASDLEPSDFEWVKPLISASWNRYEVSFPTHRRELYSEYHAVRAKDFAKYLDKHLTAEARAHTIVETVDENSVTLWNGEVITAKCVIDGRGWKAYKQVNVGYQKLLGQSVLLTEPHGLFHPMLMDATVAQEDGLRYFHLLPWDERRILIQDTHYSDRADIDLDLYRRALRRYAEGKGWKIATVESEEMSCLPIPLEGLPEETIVPASGMRAGLFHATTGYSFPFAVSFANLVAHTRPLDSRTLGDLQRQHSRVVWRRGDYFRFLNRLLFRAAKPSERYQILQKFFRLPEPLIARFYAGRLGWRDRLRILSGRMPVSLFQTITCLLERDRFHQTDPVPFG